MRSIIQRLGPSVRAVRNTGPPEDYSIRHV